MDHHLKAIPESFRLIALRKPHSQLRKNDRGFSAGDTCTFYEWLPERGFYSGRASVPMKIGEVLEDHEGLKQGWCLLVLEIPDSNITRFVTGLAGKDMLTEVPA